DRVALLRHRRAICACLSLAHFCRCHSSLRLLVAAASCIRAARKLPRAPLALPELRMRFQRSVAVAWRMLAPRRRDRFGISLILWVDAIARSLPSNARKLPGFQHWWLQSTRPWPACGNAISETALKNSWAATLDRCCRLLVSY